MLGGSMAAPFIKRCEEKEDERKRRVNEDSY